MHPVITSLNKNSWQMSETISQEESVQKQGVVLTLEDVDKNIEARLRRKYDRRIMPLVTLIYLMAFIDRLRIN